MPGTNRSIADNLEALRARIARAAERAGRPANDIALVAVSKTFPAGAIRAAHGAGVRQFGENRVQEWEHKRDGVLGLEATWHLVGHLQTNKARRAVRLFDEIDTLDRAELARALDTIAAEDGKRLPVLIEVRLGNESSKSGVAPEELPRLAELVFSLPHLELRGLMCLPPFAEDPEAARPFFRRLRELRDDLEHRFGRRLPELSMGMSHDFEVAIEEGATQIRLGTAIFGPRRAP